VGAIALMAVAATVALFKRVEAAMLREAARADRLETELKELHTMIQTGYTQTIHEATRAISDALAVVRRQP